MTHSHTIGFLMSRGGPNKKIPMFRVTQPYLNLLVKPRTFFRVSRKKKLKTNMCAYPTLPETHLFFLFGLSDWPSLSLYVVMVRLSLLASREERQMPIGELDKQ